MPNAQKGSAHNEGAAGQAGKPGKSKRKDRAHYDVTPEQFVAAWQSSSSADEVARKLNMPKPIVHARASNYREQGVNLKKMRRTSTRGLDVAGLNAIIQHLERAPATAPPPEPPAQLKAVIEQLNAAIDRKKNGGN